MDEYNGLDHLKKEDPLELNQHVPPNDQSQDSSAVDAPAFLHDVLQA
jgi:hypothetical protein